jgi:hypothetical protein
MHRRELSRLFLAAAAGAALPRQSARAEESALSGRPFPVAPGESAASVLRQEFPPGDLRRYGADLSGAGASDGALASALSSAMAGKGISVRHPGGIAWLTRPVIVPNGVAIVGSDRTACVFAYSGSGSALRSVNGPNSSGYARVTLRNLHIVAKAPVADGAAVELNAGGFAYYEIDSCQITGPFEYGVILDGTEVTHIHHSIIENSYGARSINVWIVNGAERTRGQSAGFSNAISLIDNQINGATVGIADDGGSNHYIISNNINGNSVPISMADTTAFLIQGNEMENRAVYSGDANVRLTDTGIRGGPVKGPCQAGEIVANTFGANMASGRSASLKFTGSSMHTAIAVHGNWFRYNSGQSADIDVTRLGNSSVGPNHATARSGQHYTGVHNDNDGNLLLPPQNGYPGGFSEAAAIHGDSRYVHQFAAGISAPFLQLGASSGPRILAGEAAPQGQVRGSVGDLYLCLRGGAASTLYVKESGLNSTSGWVAK